jgi:glyoxylase-like metal-dependent hydrolase (beta-lactamase superfamily II)
MSEEAAMLFRTLVPAALVIVLATVFLMAQEEPVIKVTKLTDQLHMLTTDQGAYTTNSLAFVGEDGVLLVDTQAAVDAEALKEAVAGIRPGTPKFIINTHRHVEHIGGNDIFGPDPIIIAHHLVPQKLKSGGYIFNEYPEATYPDLTFSGSMTIYFNGERIELHELAGSHDDNEIIVHFIDSKFVHLSSVVNGFNFPSVDDDGSPLKFAEMVSRAMEMLPDDVSIISGHNEIGSFNQLRPYHDMLVATEKVVRNGVDEGKNLATLQEENVLAQWESYAGSYVSTAEWTEYLFESIKVGKDPRKKVFVPLYHTWKQQGAVAALRKYETLKKDHSEEYGTDEFTLLTIGDKMAGKGHAEDAGIFLEASLAEYPDARYSYYVAYRLADLYKSSGETVKAIRYCRKALDLNPEMKAAAELLEELETN